MVLSPRIPSNANLLSSEIQKLFDDLVKNANENLQQALDSFQDWIKDISKISQDNFIVINDGLLVLLDSAVENSENLSDFLEEAFKSWAKYLSDNVVAVEDLLHQIYDRFSSSQETFRLMLEKFVRTFSDFPKLFEQLVIRAAENLSHYRESLKAVLLPLFYGGLLVFNTNKCVSALYLVLKSKSPNLRQRVNWVDMGLSSSGLSVLQMQSLTSDIFALPTNILMIAGLIEALRQVSNFSSILPNGLSVSHPVIQTILEPIVNHIKLSVSDYLNNKELLPRKLLRTTKFNTPFHRSFPSDTGTLAN